ncbi:MAG: NUDIX domain-containing protein [Acidimicrobiia bacterium]|nr:NUDIX domain-containing protein [Acidimicrobiia bacterium]
MSEAEADKALVPRDAATVLVVRDGTAGVEVVMVRRASNAAFAAGAWVFPGGAVDDSDAADALRLTAGREVEDAVAAVGSERGLGMWFAAAREAFEEAGLLVGVDASSAAGDLAELRRSVNSGERTFASVLDGMHAVIDAGAIAYVDRWVTPLGETRRFDTRFFLARALPGQEPLHDATETAEAIWASPADVLERHRAGEVFLLPPTVVNLTRIAHHADCAAVTHAAFARKVPAPVRPVIVLGDDGSVILRIDSDEIDDVVIRPA